MDVLQIAVTNNQTCACLSSKCHYFYSKDILDYNFFYSSNSSDSLSTSGIVSGVLDSEIVLDEHVDVELVRVVGLVLKRDVFELRHL